MKKKIAIVLPNLNGGGVERLHVNLANDWINNGFLVDFVLLKKEGDLFSLLSSEIQVINLNSSRIRNIIIPLMKYLLSSKPDILIAAMWPLTSMVCISWLLSRSKSQLFLSEHEILTSAYIVNKRVNYFLLKYSIKFSYNKVNGIIAVSRGVKTDLCSLADLNPNKVTIINNPAALGVPIKFKGSNKFKEVWVEDNCHYILSIGRLTAEKDHISLIKAFYLLPKKFNAKLVILGEGPLRNELKNLINSLNLNDNILMPGFVIDPYPWYQSADLFVLSSLWEGFGNVLVEAMECRVPVVSTNCLGGPEEILDYGRFGKLVPVSNPSLLALAISDSLLSNQDLEISFVRSQDYTLSKISNNYLKFFEI